MTSGPNTNPAALTLVGATSIPRRVRIAVQIAQQHAP